MNARLLSRRFAAGFASRAVLAISYAASPSLRRRRLTIRTGGSLHDIVLHLFGAPEPVRIGKAKGIGGQDARAIVLGVLVSSSKRHRCAN